jgi:ActR/RegA family two-component response regulator
MTTQDTATQENMSAAAPVRKVVLVGHCGFDEGSLKRAVSAALPGIAVTSANDNKALAAFDGADALLLVNRVLDGRFGSDSGIDLIRELADRQHSPRMMLISNYTDAQAQAVEAGALPGFGKSDLGDPDTVKKLRALSGIE